MILSDTSARHRKPPRSAPPDPDAAARYRKPPPVTALFRSRAARIAAAAVAAAVVLACLWPAAGRWMARTPDVAWVGQTDTLGLQLAGALGVQARGQQLEVVSTGVAVAPIYLNPLRSVNDLVLERIDMGVDFSGTGPVYALGDGVITNASADNGGWPGGGWITYQLTDGPDQGLMVYVAEDVTPAVQVGQRVTPSTVVGYMFEGGDGIETGWAQPRGESAESELPAAGGVGGYGPFPTMVGVNFDELLQSVGVPAAPNFGQTPSGILPPSYPANGG